MARGIPVAVSDIPIFKEIGANAANYFDPQNPKSIAQAIRTLESNSAWLESSKRSYERAKTFSWNESAKSLLDLLGQL